MRCGGSVGGKAGTKTAQVTATDGHPFWAAELHAWIKATDLYAGEWLQTSLGTKVQVASVQRWTGLQAAVHNLTVSDLHTYYVVTEDTSVLVHNCDGLMPGHAQQCQCNGSGNNEIFEEAGSADDAWDAHDVARAEDVADDVAEDASDFTLHAQQRLRERGVSLDTARQVLARTPFSYSHDGQNKIGYYDPSSKVFIAKTIDGNINTVMTNIGRDYIARLQGGGRR